MKGECDGGQFGRQSSEDDDVVASVYLNSISVGGAVVWGKVLKGIHLMQEGVAKFQVGLSKLKNAMENTSLATIGDTVKCPSTVPKPSKAATEPWSDQAINLDRFDGKCKWCQKFIMPLNITELPG